MPKRTNKQYPNALESCLKTLIAALAWVMLVPVRITRFSIGAWH
jgi:hypothetical protein